MYILSVPRWMTHGRLSDMLVQEVENDIGKRYKYIYMMTMYKREVYRDQKLKESRYSSSHSFFFTGTTSDVDPSNLKLLQSHCTSSFPFIFSDKYISM